MWGWRRGAEVGRWLGVISRAVVGSVREDEVGGDGGEGDVGDWNVVQNNGMYCLNYVSIWDGYTAWRLFMQLQPAARIVRVLTHLCLL